MGPTLNALGRALRGNFIQGTSRPQGPILSDFMLPLLIPPGGILLY